MSARSKMVQIGRSMLILDPGTMPINLGYSGREDYPEQAFPAIAYDGHNVLPTALGYQSYFAEHNRLNIGDSLKNFKVQEVFQYQSVNMRTLSIALCEDGIRIANGSEGPNGFDWQLVIDLSAGQQDLVRRQWTYCVISNKLYCYQQGQGKFYAIVNPAEYQETTVPTGITGVTIEQAWYHEPTQTGILAIKPNFINMDGQIGIFKAANRLGFWDSEGAVAWSSATQIYDFVPNTKTFAGVTTFTDVVGRIVMIKQHGVGFIIYATRSITLCSPISGSPEKWAGRAIFSDVGVVFDTQMVSAQPDSIHYAITSGGLCRITNGSPEYIEPEAMDYVRNNNEVYALSFLDSRYLMIHTTKDLDKSSLPTIIVEDMTGEGYQFPPPKQLDTSEFLEWLKNQLNGLNASQQQEFSEAQEPDPDAGPIEPPKKEALLPCWTGHGLDTNFDATVLNRPAIRETIQVQSPSEASVRWNIPVEYFRPLFTAYYWDADKRFIDKAGEEFVGVLQDTVNKMVESNAIAKSGVERFASLTTLGIDSSVKVYTGSVNGVVSNAVPVPDLSFVWRNVPIPLNFDNTSGNNCAILFEPTLYDVTFNVVAQISERCTPSEARPGKILMDGQNDGDPIVSPAILLMSQFNPNVIDAFTPLDPVLNELLKEAYSTYFPSNLPAPHQNLVTFWASSAIMQAGTEAFNIAWTASGGEDKNYNLLMKDQAAVKFAWAKGRTPSANGPSAFGAVSTSFDFTTAAMAAAQEEYCYAVGQYRSIVVPGPPEQTQIFFGTAIPNSLRVIRLNDDVEYPLSDGDLDLINSLIEKGTIELGSFGLEVEAIYTPANSNKIFDAEISGYGYYPYGGFSFRKTHRRSIFKACSPTGMEDYIFDPDDVDKLGPNTGINKFLPGTPDLKPPFSWEYPPSLPLPPNYVVFQEGTFAPYYPTYEEAIVWDTQYNKWGRYNNEHKAVYSLFPVNRTDQSIVPSEAGMLRGGALSVDGWCSVFSPENPNSRITYGKIGDYRLGWTKATKAVAQFGYMANAYVIAETSLDGDTIDSSLSQAGTASNVRRLELPFTLEGKWFNIRFEGQFNLVGLSLESEARSRR